MLSLITNYAEGEKNLLAFFFLMKLHTEFAVHTPNVFP